MSAQNEPHAVFIGYETDCTCRDCGKCFLGNEGMVRCTGCAGGMVRGSRTVEKAMWQAEKRRARGRRA